MNFISILMIAAYVAMIVFPFIFTLVVNKKAYGKLTVALIGAAGYLIACYGLNNLIELVAGGALGSLSDSNPNLFAIVSGLQQGFVENIMRFILMLLFMKNSMQKENALMYAAGHGGAEMIISGIEQASFFFADLKNPEGSSVDEIPIFSPFMIFIFFTFIFCFQISLSYIVFRGVKDKKYYLVIVAILLHALTNASTMLELPLVGLGAFLIPLAMLIYTIISYKKDQSMEFYN